MGKTYIKSVMRQPEIYYKVAQNNEDEYRHYSAFYETVKFEHTGRTTSIGTEKGSYNTESGKTPDPTFVPNWVKIIYFQRKLNSFSEITNLIKNMKGVKIIREEPVEIEIYKYEVFIVNDIEMITDLKMVTKQELQTLLKDNQMVKELMEEQKNINNTIYKPPN